jgi:ABC-type ATPase involved in cell division
MSDEILRFENVWYGNESGRDHVDNISFSLTRGEGIVLAGPEGSGKSQIMGLIMAKYLPRTGQIYHNQTNLRLQQEEEVERLRFSIGYVTQTAGLINNLSVIENIILPLRYHTDMKDDDLFAAAEFWIDRYELRHKIQARPVALSASETIRTALIRALIVEPRIILLDMVFDGLCPLASRRILELVFEDIQARQIAHIISPY